MSNAIHILALDRDYGRLSAIKAKGEPHVLTHFTPSKHLNAQVAEEQARKDLVARDHFFRWLMSVDND